MTLQEQRGTLEELKEQRQKVVQHLNLDDKELVKEQIGHFEQRWAQLQSLIERKVQDSVVTLEDMALVEARLREARDWAEEQQPALSEAMKMSPPPELAQSFLFDHLSVCSELEAKQLLLAQAMADADRILAHLGLDERQRLQQLIADTQSQVESLGVTVAQRRKHLSKAFTERTQFLMAVGQSITWVQQNEKKAQAEESVALLPDDLAKQVRTCRNIQSSLKAYQSELTSLWAQGRDLMRDASEEEKNEILTKLQELQNIFDKTLHRCGQRLQELEKALTSRKYFKTDLEKTCQWLKQADIVTFPEINLMNGDQELEFQMLKYQQIIEHAVEYENLLLTVQRAGQEILPTLNEVDHCYLDERLNALPQQYNSILALAKEKRDRVQQAILERNDFSTFLEITRNALEELKGQHDNLEKQAVAASEEEVARRRDEYGNLEGSLAHLGPAVRELMGKREAFHSRGQRCSVEEIQRLVAIHDTLKRQIDQKRKLLGACLETVVEHNRASAHFESECDAVRGSLVRLQSDDRLCATDSLTGVLGLLESVESLSSQAEGCERKLKSLNVNFEPSAIQDVTLRQESLRSLQSEVRRSITEREKNVCQNEDFTRGTEKVLAWLVAMKDKIEEPLAFSEVEVENVQEELRRLRIVEEEVEGVLRVAGALGSREKQRFDGRKEKVPASVEKQLQRLHKLEAEVTKAISTKQVRSY